MILRQTLPVLGRKQDHHPSPPMTGSCIFSIFANSHSLLQRGQLLRVRSHFDMQSRWKTCPQLPQAMLRPSSDAEVGFAWYSILGSCKLLRQIAQVSVQIDQDHTATAFHCHTKAQSREMVSWVWICTHPFYFKVFLICRHGKVCSRLSKLLQHRCWANNFLLSKHWFHRISISVFWNHKINRDFSVPKTS